MCYQDVEVPESVKMQIKLEKKRREKEEKAEKQQKIKERAVAKKQDEPATIFEDERVPWLFPQVGIAAGRNTPTEIQVRSSPISSTT